MTACQHDNPHHLPVSPDRPLLANQPLPGKPETPRPYHRLLWGLLVAAVLNGAVVLFLANGAFMSSSPQTPPLSAVSLDLVDPPVDSEIAPQTEPVSQPQPPEQSPPPKLPTPTPTPAIPSEPVPTLALELPSVEFATACSLPIPRTLPSARKALVATPTAPPAPPIAVTTRASEPAFDTGPALIRPPTLSAYYPYRARRQGITGWSRLSLTIDRKGTVTAVSVTDSEPAGIFENAARRVGRSLRFRPARKANNPVAATVSLKLTWQLEQE